MWYRWIRDLHLYTGLFISPFVLLFAASVFSLNHAKLALGAARPADTYQNLRIRDGFDRVNGREAVDRAREILPHVETTGEVGFLRYVATDSRLIFPVSRPVVNNHRELTDSRRSSVLARAPISSC